MSNWSRFLEWVDNQEKPVDERIDAIRRAQNTARWVIGGLVVALIVVAVLWVR